jgi:Protein kinase domain
MSRVLPPPTKLLPGCVRENVKTDFENKELLGEGSFGKVYKVVHRESGQLFAIKVVSKERMRHSSFLKQISNEIMLMQGLDHPNIVRLLTYFENEASIYLVLELGGVLCPHPAQPLRRAPQRKKVRRGPRRQGTRRSPVPLPDRLRHPLPALAQPAHHPPRPQARKPPRLPGRLPQARGLRLVQHQLEHAQHLLRHARLPRARNDPAQAAQRKARRLVARRARLRAAHRLRALHAAEREGPQP